MKLEDQVCSLSLSKRLKELGVPQESWCYWKIDKVGTYFTYGPASGGCPNDGESFSAFTVVELGEMLPDCTPSYKYTFGQNHPNTGWHIKYEDVGLNIRLKIGHKAVSKTEANARAMLLIYLIENKLIKMEELNERGSKAIVD